MFKSAKSTLQDQLLGTFQTEMKKKLDAQVVMFDDSLKEAANNLKKYNDELRTELKQELKQELLEELKKQ